MSDSYEVEVDIYGVPGYPKAVHFTIRDLTEHEAWVIEEFFKNIKKEAEELDEVFVNKFVRYGHQ